MDKKAPLPSLRGQNPNWNKAAALAGEWELQQLARRLWIIVLIRSARTPS